MSTELEKHQVEDNTKGMCESHSSCSLNDNINKG